MGFNNTTERPLKNHSFRLGNIVDNLGSAQKRIQFAKPLSFLRQTWNTAAELPRVWALMCRRSRDENGRNEVD